MTELSIPSGARFSCQQCGECCRTWSVYVAPERREALLAHEWVQELDQATEGGALPAVAGQRCPVATVKGDRLECAFLGPDSLCQIHKREGGDKKPIGCQQFPFGFTRTPEARLEVWLDPACQAVARGEGAPLDVAELTAFAEQAEIQTLAAQTPLREGVMLDWGATRALRAHLARLLRGQGEARVRLLAASLAVAQLGSEFAHGATVSAEQLEPKLAELTPELLLGTAAQATQDPRRVRMITALLIASIQNAWATKRGLPWGQRTGYLLRTAWRTMQGAGDIDLAVVSMRFEAEQIAALPFEEAEDLWEGWLDNLASRPFWTRGFRLAMGMQAATWQLARWYAAGHALSRGAERVERADQARGIQLAEKFGGGRLLDELGGQGILGNLVRSIMSEPRFPAAMLGGAPPDET